MKKQILTNTCNTDTCCFSADTLILMADMSQKRVDQIRTGEMIMSIDEEVQEVGCDVENTTDTYAIIKTANEHEITITGDHPVFTEDGWKQVKHLVVGDKLKRAYLLENGAEFEEITSIEWKEEKQTVYNLICEDKPMIANGFICSDFHMQYKLVLCEKYKKNYY